jgi:hypothetical protein
MIYFGRFNLKFTLHPRCVRLSIGLYVSERSLADMYGRVCGLVRIICMVDWLREEDDNNH